VIDQKMIPDAAVAAAARAIGEETYVGNQQTLRDAGRAAIAAALNAWPGMKLHQQDINAEYSYFVLPLPQEASDE
jgi:hypothetical protein